jgi:hypothetical protein
MTPDEIQAAINGMLAVQRELQESDLKRQQQIDGMQASVEGMLRIEEATQQRSIENRGYLDRLADIAIEIRAETAELREQNAQLRRGMDYLLSKDGGEG